MCNIQIRRFSREASTKNSALTYTANCVINSMKTYVDFSGRKPPFRHTTLCAVFFYGKKHPWRNMKKLKLPSEAIYLAAIVLLALSVAMLTTSGYGLSMLVAPAYILSLILGIEFGFAEYIVQGILIVLFCIIVRRFKAGYLFSFVSCLLYGAILIAWQKIPAFDTSINPPESYETWQRVLLFIFGDLLTFFSVVLSFKAYLHPQVYDFFVKGISERYHLRQTVVKTVFDLCCLAVGSAMTLIAFKEFRGIYWGTLATAICGGTIIGFFSKMLDKIIIAKPLFPKLEKYFEISDDVLSVKTDEYVRE